MNLPPEDERPAAGEGLDAQGCLTEAGVAAMQSAAPGTAPVALATHVAGCTRCQERLLALERRPSSGPPNPARQGVQQWSLAVMVGAMLLMTLAALWTMWRLMGGNE
jgi:hypothetical protein